ncbi:MAG: hypothetical protein QJR09_05135 [Micrococcus sp.]|nr:hypothetical protein [Micrococcus sp.]
MQNTPETLEIARQNDLSTELLDAIDPLNNCPGFRLWAVTLGGNRYLMAGDSASTVETRIYFRTHRKLTEEESIELLGDNPDVEEWDRQQAALQNLTR